MNSTRGGLALSDPVRLRVILEEAGQARSLEFDAEQVTIGRTADNQIRITDALSSRHHCQLRRREGGWVVADLKSRNGTKLNGEPLTTEHVLQPGDRIEVGDSIVHFGQKRGAAAAASPSVKTKRRERPPEPAATPPAKDAGEAPPLQMGDGATIVAGDQRVAVAALPFVIGRKKSCGLSLDHADVSNEHCMIVEDGGALHLVDLGSTNGTLVDGERLRGRTALRRGAVITLGPSLQLRVEATGAARPARAEGPPRSDRHDRPRKVTSDRTAREVPKSDRHDRPKKVTSDRHHEVAEAPPKKTAAAVGAVDDLAALDARAAARPPRARARAAAADDASAAAMVAGEGDVAPDDFTARLEAAATEQASGGGGGGAAIVVVALVLVLGAVGATAASALVARPEGDPRPSDGLVENWSFEEAAAPGGGVPGWELAADGAFLVKDGVSFGKQALALQAAPGSRPEFRSAQPIRVTGEKTYRVRAAVSLDAGVGAALRVDWSAEDDPTFARTSWAVVLDPTSAPTGAWRDVGGTVVAPRGATLARVIGVALPGQDGPSARARFDRVHLVAAAEQPQRFVLDGPAGLSMQVDERGLVSLHRDGRELAAELALALDPADPLCHQRAARVDQPSSPQPDESLLALGAIPEGAGGRVDYAFSAGPDAGGLRLRWSAGARAAPLFLVFVLPRLDDVAPLELDGKDVTQALPGEPLSVSEMAWGKAARQVSFRFTGPATLTVTRHGAGVSLAFAVPSRPIATGEAGVGVDIGAASTGTREQIKRLFDEADQAHAAGDHAKALEAYQRLITRFSHDPAVVARARKASSDAQRRADRLAELVSFVQQEAQELPLPPLAQAARAVVDELERGFAGTPQADRARRDLGRIDEAVSAARRREEAARVRELLDRAQRLREGGHVELARMIYQGILDHMDEATPGVPDAKAKLAALPAGGAR